MTAQREGCPLRYAEALKDRNDLTRALAAWAHFASLAVDLVCYGVLLPHRFGCCSLTVLTVVVASPACRGLTPKVFLAAPETHHPHPCLCTGSDFK